MSGVHHIGRRPVLAGIGAATLATFSTLYRLGLRRSIGRPAC
jgi:hypothetical protein